MDEEEEYIFISKDDLDFRADSSATSTASIYPMVGRIISDKLLDSEVVVSIVRREWKESIYGKVDIKHLEDNTYLFSFHHAELAEKVRGDGPWVIMGHFLSLRHWESDVRLKMIEFTPIPIWVQVHGMRGKYVTKEIAEFAGGHIGKFLRVDQESLKHPCRKPGFVRVMVNLDSYAVIKTGMWVIIDGGIEEHYLEFKYEKMADFCYNCGRFGHYIDECMEGVFPHPQFGPWLKAIEDTSFDAVVNIQDKKDDDKLLVKSRGRKNRQPKQESKDHMKCPAKLTILVLVVLVLILTCRLFLGELTMYGW